MAIKIVEKSLKKKKTELRSSEELKVEEERLLGKIGEAATEEAQTVRNRKKLFRIRYERLKQKIIELEAENYSKLVLFSSGGEWFKMGGNSLLIYKYVIAPMLNLKPTIQPDTDYMKTQFVGGLISFRGPEAIRKKLERAKVLKEERKGGATIVFELNFSVTEEQLKEFSDEARYEQERALTILKPPVVLVPVIYDKLRHVQKRVFETVRKMSIFERDYNGLLIAEYSRKMVKYYMMINNRMMDEVEGWEKILEANNLLMIEIAFAAELKIWRQDIAISVGAELIEIKRDAEKELRRIEKEKLEKEKEKAKK